jgi:hypothetical protein
MTRKWSPGIRVYGHPSQTWLVVDRGNPDLSGLHLVALDSGSRR